VLQALVALGSLAFVGWVRPKLMTIYRDADMALPMTAKLALSGWLLPCSAALGIALAIAALASSGQRGRRLRWVSIGLTISGLVFVAAALAAFAPLLA
jgi:hypothetical protein